LDNGLPWIVEHTEDQIGDSACVFPENAGRSSAFQLLHFVQWKFEHVFEDSPSNTGLYLVDSLGAFPATPQMDSSANTGNNRNDDRDPDEDGEWSWIANVGR
jgi:hypothetical protein